MRILTTMRKQDLVYWPPDGHDSYGKPALGEPQELKGRWEDKNELFIDMEGTQQVSKAKVFVGEDIEVGGVVMLGSLDDVDSGTEPKEHEGAYEIRAFEKTPDFRGKVHLRMGFL